MWCLQSVGFNVGERVTNPCAVIPVFRSLLKRWKLDVSAALGAMLTRSFCAAKAEHERARSLESLR